MTKAKRRELRELVYAKCGSRCGIAGWRLPFGRCRWTIYHRVWLAVGCDHIDNREPSCRRCNNYKLFFTLDQFRKMVADPASTCYGATR